MPKKRRLEITIETHEVTTLFRKAADSCAARCTLCGGGVPMTTPERAAAVAPVSTRQIYRWVEAGTLHFVETPGKALLVCPASLAALLDRRPGLDDTPSTERKERS